MSDRDEERKAIVGEVLPAVPISRAPPPISPITGFSAPSVPRSAPKHPGGAASIKEALAVVQAALGDSASPTEAATNLREALFSGSPGSFQVNPETGAEYPVGHKRWGADDWKQWLSSGKSNVGWWVYIAPDGLEALRRKLSRSEGERPAITDEQAQALIRDAARTAGIPDAKVTQRFGEDVLAKLGVGDRDQGRKAAKAVNGDTEKRGPR